MLPASGETASMNVPSSDTSWAGTQSAIEVHQTRLQALIRRPDEDWSGVTDRVTRKRLQNKLNQRAQRARKLHRDQEQAVIRRATTDQKNPRQPVLILPRPEKPHEWHRLPQPTNLSVAVAMMASFDTLAYERYNDGNPCLDHLLSLSKFNVLRAIIGNSKVLGLTTQDMQDDMLSPFNSPTRIAPIGWDLPASLYPTPVQRAIPHHPWLDCFPFPLLRENLIRASGALNDCELCGDVMDPANEEIGMLVWGDPWMPQNWEVSETFLRKWFWVVNECPEILWSTNHWRMKRGMRRVDFTMLSRISSSHQMTRVQRKGA